MNQDMCGWTGQMLYVDLSGRVITVFNTGDYAERFLGGRGIATALYWKYVHSDVGAFDPENCLIFMTGPLAATGVQGASRMVIAAKSPMTVPEGFCYGNIGGAFGPFLKKAGFDGIVVSGRSVMPCYLYITDGHCEIRDAAGVWGKGVYGTEQFLKAAHSGKTQFLTTGIAGERMCRTATVGSNRESSATGGFGAVMGSKNLKAIAVDGTGKVRVARSEAVSELNRFVSRLNMDKLEFLKAIFPRLFKYEGGKRTRSKCFQCGLPCLRTSFQTGGEEQFSRKCQSSTFYLPWVEKRPREPIWTALTATGFCNDLSICTMEIDNIIRWLDACFKEGDLTEEESGLPLSEIGSQRFIQILVEKIAYREGLGDILAEGLLRAKQMLPEKLSRHFSEFVSDVGHVDLSGRELIVTALLYAFEPREPISMVNEFSFTLGYYHLKKDIPDKSPVSYEVFKNVSDTFWGHAQAWDLTTYTGKAEAAVRIQNRTYANESLVLCSTIYPVMFSAESRGNVGDPAIESRLFSAVTGIETDEAGLHTYGERIFNLQRAIMLRERKGGVEADSPGEFNFTIPVTWSEINPGMTVPGDCGKDKSIKGNLLDRAAYASMRRRFYLLRGWDPETGNIHKETLCRLGLREVLPS